jgi:hypothetical protein
LSEVPQAFEHIKLGSFGKNVVRMSERAPDRSSITHKSSSTQKDLIVSTEESFLAGAESSFPASDPPSYMAGIAMWVRPL